MRIKFFIIACIIIIQAGCPATVVRKAENAAPEVKSFFGDKILEIIDGAGSADSYKVKTEKMKVPMGKNICGYPVISQGPALNSSQISTLKNILLDEKTYDFKWAKKAFVFPDYAIVLKKGNEELILLIDFYRKEFLFVYNGKELVEDFDNAEKQVRKLVDEIFR